MVSIYAGRVSQEIQASKKIKEKRERERERERGDSFQVVTIYFEAAGVEARLDGVYRVERARGERPRIPRSIDRRFHLQFLRLGRHRRRAGARSRSDGIFVADESLGVEFEGFAHELGDTAGDISDFPSNHPRRGRERSGRGLDFWKPRKTHPQTTTSSSIWPHNLATVELSFARPASTASSSKRLRTLLYMATSSSSAGSSSCSRR